MIEKPKDLPFDGFLNRDGVSKISFTDFGITLMIFHNQKKISLSLDNGKTSNLFDDSIEERKRIINKITNIKKIYGGLVSCFFLKSNQK